MISLSLLAAHFVGDFLLQSDWMATNKSKNYRALSIHIGAYMLPFFAWALWQFGNTPLAVQFLAITAAAHFAQDAVTSRITSRLWFFQREAGIWAQASYAVPKHGRELINPWTPIDSKRHWFFVAIGADQLLHFATLAWTVTYIV